jgi:ABC-type dipeptide/oligopeptide/nickel transport system ATPase component
MGILYISHDLLSIAGFCHRVAILHEGRIVEFADTNVIFEAPSHPYTKKLIGAIPAVPDFSLSRNSTFLGEAS